MAKVHRLPKQESLEPRAAKPNDLTHRDTTRKQSFTLRRGQYGSVLIDDYCRWVNAKILKMNDEVRKHFKDYRAESVTKYEQEIKVWRTDNAKKYIEKSDFNGWLREKGIKYQICVVYDHA